jgi:hypothetical protein
MLGRLLYFVVIAAVSQLFFSLAFAIDDTLNCILHQTPGTVAGSHVVSAADRKAWDPSEFTDPRKGPSGKFRYIIFANSYMGEGDFRPNSVWKIEDRLAQTGVISTSLITNERPTPFAPAGVILKVPTENFIAASPGDMMSGSLRNEPERFSSTYGLPTPDNLIKETDKETYNEVLIWKTTPAGSKVEVVGYYLADGTNNGLSMDCPPQLRDAVIGAAKAKGLPVVHLH